MKLVILEEYLDAYTTIMESNWNQKPWYVDTHAGTGQTVIDSSGTTIDGSAIRAIDNYEGFFEKFYLYELDPESFETLHETLADRFGRDFDVRETKVDGENFMVARDYEDPEIVIMRLDSNEGASFLANVAKPPRHWFTFVDPKGLTARKDTLDTLIERGNMDILINYQTRGVMRSAATGAEHAHGAVSRILGDDDWPVDGDDDEYVQQFKERLERLPEMDEILTRKLVSPDDKRNRFDLVFACANSTGRRIMDDIMTQDALWSKAAKETGQTGLGDF